MALMLRQDSSAGLRGGLDHVEVDPVRPVVRAAEQHQHPGRPGAGVATGPRRARHWAVLMAPLGKAKRRKPTGPRSQYASWR